MIQNYFEMFSIETQYEIDNSYLHSQYLALHSLLEKPDNNKNKVFLPTAFEVNKAYKTLKNELLRAEYLLSLNNIDVYSVNFRDRISEKELAHIWGDLEFIEETNEFNLLKAELTKQEKIKKQLISNLSIAFKQKKNEDAIDLTLKLKYLTNLIEKIKQKCK